MIPKIWEWMKISWFCTRTFFNYMNFKWISLYSKHWVLFRLDFLKYILYINSSPLYLLRFFNPTKRCNLRMVITCLHWRKVNVIFSTKDSRREVFCGDSKFECLIFFFSTMENKLKGLFPIEYYYLINFLIVCFSCIYNESPLLCCFISSCKNEQKLFLRLRVK